MLAQKVTLQKEHQTKLSPVQHKQLSPVERIALFKDLFASRNDVFALKWENQNNGKSGYSPACHNEWQKGICNKPYTKCTDCKNQNFKALDDQEVFKHLTGKQIIGSYALSKLGACRFLAIDFDKSDWQQAVKSTAQAATSLDVPYAIEISQSGNGAHLWVFFNENVPAKLARKLGFLLLDKAMTLCPTLTFDSYDRIFPNQDMLPEGGFGNLIALPLQQLKRKTGFTEFVTKDLEPIVDQWQHLNQLNKLSHLDIVKLVAQFSDAQKMKEQPWERQSELRKIIPECPKSVTIVRSNRLYILVSSLPSQLLSVIRKLASFSNPEFFKKQSLRFSTHGTPRFISLALMDGEYLSIPRGCEDDLVELLTTHKIAAIFADKTSKGTRLSNIKMGIKLRKEQTQAVNQMIKHDIGILHAPTAFGKTVAAIGIMVKRKINTLVLVHNKQLVEQWQERIKIFTQSIECGIHIGVKKSLTGQIDIATYQSLVNRKNNTINPVIHDYGQIIIDECHHVPAASFELVLSESSAKYIVGLTATPNRQDGLQKIMFMLAGSVRHRVTEDSSKNFIQKAFVRSLASELPVPTDNKEKRHISEIYQWLTEDHERNTIIANDVISAVNNGRQCLLLSERRGHAVTLLQMLRQNGIDCVLLTGGMKTKERNAANQNLSTAQVIVATGKYVGEGFDLPRLDTLFITLPISWKGTLAQYAGRIHRSFEDKNEVQIYDYVEVNVPMLNRMFQKREKGYLALGYEIVAR